MMNGRATQMCSCAYFFFCKGLKMWVRAADAWCETGNDAHLGWRGQMSTKTQCPTHFRDFKTCLF